MKVKKKTRSKKTASSPIRDVTRTVGGQKAIRLLQPGTRVFMMGDCRIFLSQQPETKLYHMTISTSHRDPTWGEIVRAWYNLVPDAAERVAAMMLPKLADYINVHEFCFRVHELDQSGMEDQGDGKSMLGSFLQVLGGNRGPSALEDEQAPLVYVDETTGFTEKDYRKVLDRETNRALQELNRSYPHMTRETSPEEESAQEGGAGEASGWSQSDIIDYSDIISGMSEGEYRKLYYGTWPNSDDPTEES
jgi:hypothetical protein